MDEIRDFGFKKSDIDGTELVFGLGQLYDIPKSFTYRNNLPPVLNQGELPICVPCSLSAYYNWRLSLLDGITSDKNVDLMGIFNGNDLGGQGMTFKEAFKVAKHEGVDTDSGIIKIGHYGVIKNSLSLKYALLMNGPCFGALPVYSYDKDFWKKKNGDSLLGYHAISIVGYDNDGFIIRNSWGNKFADNGYTFLKNEDFGKLIEIWTIID